MPVIDVFDWYASYERKEDDFLILGKGPSFSCISDINLDNYVVMSLNHVVKELTVDVAHIIDIDVVESCADALARNATWLLMPQVPHINCKASCLRLEDFLDTIPILRKFYDQNRLLSYPLWSSNRGKNDFRINGTFSGSVVVDLLSRLGVKGVKSLGVDGGYSYSLAFDDLKHKTLFKNGHSSFNVQQSEINESLRNSEMTYEKLVEPTRVFIACSDGDSIAAHVLDYSIRKHTSYPVEVFFMRNMPVPQARDKKNISGTPFSFNRFLIPKLAGYTGKAIYLDTDMLVFDDIRKLWDIPFNGKKVLCSTQTDIPRGWENKQNNDLGEGRYWTPGRQLSVMLLDCSRLDWDVEKIVAGLDQGKYSYKELMARLCIVADEHIGDTIPNEWNCLEWYEEGVSQLVHFTVVPTQPWRNDRSALNKLWMDACEEALQAGAIPAEIIEMTIANRYGKPALIELLEKYRNTANQQIDGEDDDDTMTAESAESTRLRHMLWQSMIDGFNAKKELQRIQSSPAFWLEDTLLRKPWTFGRRVLGWAGRRLGV